MAKLALVALLWLNSDHLSAECATAPGSVFASVSCRDVIRLDAFVWYPPSEIRLDFTRLGLTRDVSREAVQFLSIDTQHGVIWQSGSGQHKLGHDQ